MVAGSTAEPSLKAAAGLVNSVADAAAHQAFDIWAIIDPLLANVPTIIVATFAVWVAAAQSRTAKEKLRVDLFDRRFAAWEAINSATEARVAEIAALTIEDFNRGELPLQAVTLFSDAKRTARFLFSAAVRAQIETVEAALQSYHFAKVDSLYVREATVVERQRQIGDTLGPAYMAVWRQLDILMEMVEEALDLSRIALMSRSVSDRLVALGSQVLKRMRNGLRA